MVANKCHVILVSKPHSLLKPSPTSQTLSNANWKSHFCTVISYKVWNVTIIKCNFRPELYTLKKLYWSSLYNLPIFQIFKRSTFRLWIFFFCFHPTGIWFRGSKFAFRSSWFPGQGKYPPAACIQHLLVCMNIERHTGFSSPFFFLMFTGALQKREMSTQTVVLCPSSWVIWGLPERSGWAGQFFYLFPGQWAGWAWDRSLLSWGDDLWQPSALVGHAGSQGQWGMGTGSGSHKTLLLRDPRESYSRGSALVTALRI